TLIKRGFAALYAFQDSISDMEDAANLPTHSPTSQSYKLSWLAYIRPAIVFLVLLFISVPFGIGSLVSILIMLAALGLLVYQILFIRGVELYTNDDGVWLYCGVFPWQKGISGVKWRDVDEAVFYTGFVSWACNSYAVRVGHRFTKSGEIHLFHVRDGRAAVEHINTLHRTRLSED